MQNGLHDRTPNMRKRAITMPPKSHVLFPGLLYNRSSRHYNVEAELEIHDGVFTVRYENNRFVLHPKCKGISLSVARSHLRMYRGSEPFLYVGLNPDPQDSILGFATEPFTVSRNGDYLELELVPLSLKSTSHPFFKPCSVNHFKPFCVTKTKERAMYRKRHYPDHFNAKFAGEPSVGQFESRIRKIGPQWLLESRMVDKKL